MSDILAHAANILDISEYDVLNRAYQHWHGAEPDSHVLQETYRCYLRHGELIHWARNFALQVIEEFEMSQAIQITPYCILAWLWSIRTPDYRKDPSLLVA